MMIKHIPAGSWDFGVKPMELIKTSSRGLRGNDLKEFIKRAGYGLADKLRTTEMLPGEALVHLIAVGSTEGYNCNRNGDGFKNATCRECHDTFQKYGRWFREHENTDTSRSYGIIKTSAFNEPMQRIELIIGLNGNKEAAQRNKGLVADKEMEDLAADRDIPVSMAVKIAFDICSGCGNKARNRKEYCTEDTCKYGGCKHNLCKVAEDGHILHVDNPAPLTWFDISRVWRGADRTAFVLGHVKAASDKTVGGAEMAELLQVTAPPELLLDSISPSLIRLTKLAYTMARLEASLEGGKLSSTLLDQAIHQDYRNKLAASNSHTLWGTLARHKVLLSPEEFSTTTKQASFQHRLPGIYQRMIADIENLEGYLSNNTYNPQQSELSPWFTKKASFPASRSLDPEQVASRLSELSMRFYNCEVKRASSQPLAATIALDPHAEASARKYATYQLQFLDYLDNYGCSKNLDWYQNYVVRANYLSR